MVKIMSSETVGRYSSKSMKQSPQCKFYQKKPQTDLFFTYEMKVMLSVCTPWRGVLWLKTENIIYYGFETLRTRCKYAFYWRKT